MKSIEEDTRLEAPLEVPSPNSFERTEYARTTALTVVAFAALVLVYVYAAGTTLHESKYTSSTRGIDASTQIGGRSLAEPGLITSHSFIVPNTGRNHGTFYEVSLTIRPLFQ